MDRKILIVEDEGIAAMNLERTLDDLGYLSAGIAFTAEEAVEKAKLMRPDLVLMDIQLAGRADGIEAAGEIQERLGTPVVFLTAFSDDQTLARAKQKSPFGFLVKPVRDQALKSTIEIAIQKHQDDRRLVQSEERFRSLVDQSPAGMVLVDGDDRIVKANAAFAQMVGVEIAGCENRYLMEFLPFTERAAYVSRHARLLNGDTEPGFDLGVTTSSGSIVWTHVSGTTVFEPERPGPCVSYTLVNISERYDRESTLKATAQVLARNNEELERFAGLLSADLKLPIQRANQELERVRASLTRTEVKDLTPIQMELDSISQMLEGLVDYSRALPRPKHVKPIPLMRVMGEAVEALKEEIDAKGARIQYRFLPTVMGTELQLRKLFQNLLSNAIKFNKRRPEIVIHFDETATEYILSVRDNGIGVGPESVALIFDVFAKGHDSAFYSGSGIGLAVCKKIVDNLNGRIWVESHPEVGSVFYVALPRT